MTGSVNGQNGNQQFIKLYNGKTFDLKNLDKLIGQSSEGSVFASFDGVNNGGNANNVFDEAEINSIKAQIMSYQTNDGVINQDELNKMFGYEGIVDENNNPKNFDSNKLAALFDVLSQEIDEKQVKEEKPNSTSSTEEPEPKQYETVTKYVVQAGDSPLKIAQRLGYTGNEAKAYAKELTEKLKNDGAINKRGWLTAGQQIEIIGEHQETLATSADYTEDKAEINQRFASMAPARPRKSRQAKIPASVTARAEQIKKDGGICQIVQNEDGSYSIIQTSGGNYMKNHKIASIELGFDKNGIFKTQTNTLTNGKAIDGKMQSGKMVWGKAYDPKLRKERAADKTSSKNRVNINTVRNQAKTDAAALKTQINGASLNDNTRKMLNTKIQNQDIAYILEAYPNLVKDIYDEWGMGNNDVQKYVVNKLNSRLRELGMNKYCLPADTSKMKPADLQKACNNIAAFIRKTDAQTGYVFKPNKGDEGKVNYARLESQKGARVYTPKKKKVTSKPATQQPDTKNNANKANETERQRQLTPSEWGYPEALKDRIIDLRLHGIGCKVEKTIYGYKLTLDETKDFHKRNLSLTPSLNIQPNGEVSGGAQDITSDMTNMYLPEFLQGKKTVYFDNEGKLIEQKESFSHSGKTVTTTYDENGKVKDKKTHYPTYIEYGRLSSQRSVNDKHTATDITINRPEDLPEEGKAFATSLEQNKAQLMKVLNLTNAQYDQLAMLAMGVAEQETHWGKYYHTNTKGEGALQETNIMKQTLDGIYFSEDIPESVKDTFFNVGGMISDKVTQYHKKYSDGTKSWGMTQCKVDEFMKDPILKAQFNAFGITCGEDIRTSPEKQAIATIIALNNKRITAITDWQERLAANNANISDPSKQITENDLIVLLYNGNSAKLDLLKAGNLTIDQAPYARNIRVYSNDMYNITTDTYSKNRADALGAISQGNNGKIGTVIFMPCAYSTDVGNTKEDILTLETALRNNSGITEVTRNQLILAARKNEVSFGYGLKPEEAASITEEDAKLILNKLNALKSKITSSQIVDPAKIRQQAQITQDDFRSEYLQSRQIIVSNRDIPESSITLLGYDEIIDERLNSNINTVITSAHRAGRDGSSQRAISNAQYDVNVGNYRGFMAQNDLGVNPYYSNGEMIPESYRNLAECASAVAADMSTSGLCLTGVKASIETAGVDKKMNIVYPNGHPKAGRPIDVPKDLYLYYNAHPEKFEEVKYVNLGNGSSREFNASDVRRLPAGYLGIFIPGAGYEDQAGHAFITNGNGQGYADETDNLRWDDFKSAGAGNGKGEHGTYKIYRLVT